MNEAQIRRDKASQGVMKAQMDIAVVGIGCRFPGGSNDPHSLWCNLLAGKDCISEVPSDRWSADAHFHPKRGVSGKSATKWGGFIDGIDGFDAGFFNISPREAALMDPQQRMLLEVCWEALEDAGHIPVELRNSPVGVFMGGFTLDYMLMQLGGTEYRSIEPHTASGSMMTMLANRLSYVFGFQGPSLAVDTACSSSLVAVHLACRSLAVGESELAIAGGVNALLGPSYTIAESRAGMLSPTGRSRAFDSRADGYVRGEGVGIVVLKRLEDALAADDHVYAVIRTTAVNQDGHSEGLTVPSGNAQSSLIRTACAAAGVAPNEISYVEAHGTGTPVGDPIESNAIGSVIGEGRDSSQPCLIGSIKTNIGHTEAAAGVAGLIKTSLVLHHGVVPPHLHFVNPNPKIDLESLKLKIPLAPTSLPTNDGIAFASVNSFGFGGTNAHAILATAPRRQSDATLGCDLAPTSEWLLPLSGRHPQALRALGASYAAALDKSGMLAEAALDDICWSAATRREHHPYRACIAGASRLELIVALQALQAGIDKPNIFHNLKEEVRAQFADNQPVFVFSGMGPQWWGMGQALYQTEPVFRNVVERCAALFEAQSGWSILAQMLTSEAGSRMADTDVAQPANFILQVALAELLGAWGIRPAAIIGHSAGEPAAAYVAGCLSLEDAVRVVYHRSRLQHQTAGQGRMVAVGLGPEEALIEMGKLNDLTLSLAAINSPALVTIAGSSEGIGRLREALKARAVFVKELRVQVPFHSVFMEPLEAAIHATLASIVPKPAAIPLYSTVTGDLIVGAAHDAEYWYRNVRQPVYFADAINAMLRADYRCFVELAPHPVLSGSIHECAAVQGLSVEVIPTLHRERPETTQIRAAIASLYCMGNTIAWDDVLPVSRPVSLPTYPWRHERYWHETPASAAIRISAPPHPILGRRVESEVPTWEVDLDRSSLAFLQDHCIQGAVVFPGAGYMEMALYAAHNIFGELAITTISNIAFERALYLSADTPVTLHISVDPETYRFRITSRPYGEVGAAWQVHCTGQLLTGNRAHTASVDLAAIQARCTTDITADDCYYHFERLGLEYGPTFQGITRLQQGVDEALAWVDIPAALHDSMAQFNIHPAVLDVCFQTLAAALPFEDDKSIVYMPTGVAEGCMLQAIPKRMCIHALISRKDDKGMVGDIRMLDEAGRLLLEIRGCTARALGGDAAPFAVTPQKLYSPQWITLDTPMEVFSAAHGYWLIYGGDSKFANDIAATLAQRGQSAILVNPTTHGEANTDSALRIDPTEAANWQTLIAGIAHDRPLNGVINLDLCRPDIGEMPNTDDIIAEIERGCISTLNITKALAALPTLAKPRLWIVTRGTQPVLKTDRPDPFRAPVWGMARVLGHGEHIDLWGGIVDLPAIPGNSDARHIVDECLCSDTEDQIAWRDDVRYLMRLIECDASVRLPKPPRLRADASYLITGGLGALGLEVSRWMVQCGARHLILIGRDGLPPRPEWAGLAADDPRAQRVARIQQLERMGANVTVERMDIADRSALDALIARLRAEGRPLVRGVMHAAGVAQPRLLTQSNNSEFLSVMPAKVLGAWNLHCALRDEPLDFFVLFSSVASVVTSMGQGNYAAANTFLDMLAYRRRADGLPATSINWGPWGDVGMATKLDLVTFFHDRGFFPMTAEQGCEALGWLMSDRVGQAVVIGAKWITVGESSPLGIAAPVLERLIAAEREQERTAAGNNTAPAANILEVLNKCGEADARLALLLEYVCGLACRVLRVDTGKLGFDDAMNTRGLDSMMAIELKNRIEKSLKVAVAIVDLLRGASVRAIAVGLHNQLEVQRLITHDPAIAAIVANINTLDAKEIETLLADNPTMESTQ